MARHDPTAPMLWAASLNWRRAALLALLLPAILATPSVARADSGMEMMLGYAMHVGVFGEYGRAEYAGGKANPGSATAYGFRYYERQGLITGTITAILVIMGAANEANRTTSESHTENRGGTNYRVTTTTAVYSGAERAAIVASGAETASAAFSTRNQSFDLEIYSRNLGGDASGWRMNSFFGFPFWKMMFEIGYGMGSIDLAMAKDGQPIYASYAYLGMPMRLDLALGPFWTFLEADWNFFGYGNNARASALVGNTLLLRNVTVLPWKLGIASNLFDGRLFGEAVLTTPDITSGELAVKGTLGLRF